jgi:two-component system sensor histidine kinase/response regulator
VEREIDVEHKSTILIVDDDPTARRMLQALLFREGYDLALAANGPEALARLDELAPDAILLDVMMPGMDGFQVCRRLKADERWRHIPIILVTALATKADLVRGLDAGADEFLSKPVNDLELRARVRSMLRVKKQYDELEATLHLREDLARMTMHDMGTFLTSITLLTELLLKRSTIAPDTIAPEYVEEIEEIQTHVQRLNSLLNDMLIVAKMEAGKLILNRSTVDMNQLVLAVERNHSVIAQTRGIDLVIDLPEASRQIPLDANLFQRVLDNLIANALKFSPAESTVTLRVEYPEAQTASQLQEPRVRIQVLDEGPGIPEDHRDRVFDKFEIVALKREGVSQFGLGLAFCKMVVEAHDGQIFVGANEPRGAVFTVEI